MLGWKFKVRESIQLAFLLSQHPRRRPHFSSDVSVPPSYFLCISLSVLRVPLPLYCFFFIVLFSLPVVCSAS